MLGLGSNAGDSRAILSGAVGELAAVLSGLRVSPVYESRPQDFTDQPNFLNLVVAGDYDGEAEALLSVLNGIEARFGRDRAREIPKGPRTLDIDIELFGDRVLHTARLAVPHERMRDRLFVLTPLLDLEPECRDPETGVLFREIASRLPDQGVVKAGRLNGY
jgi:2-amino-4-hydroxy-6-hydroxymethyldihydropteridine diphosphokinase